MVFQKYYVTRPPLFFFRSSLFKNYKFSSWPIPHLTEHIMYVGQVFPVSRVQGCLQGEQCTQGTHVSRCLIFFHLKVSVHLKKNAWRWRVMWRPHLHASCNLFTTNFRLKNGDRPPIPWSYLCKVFPTFLHLFVFNTTTTKCKWKCPALGLIV